MLALLQTHNSRFGWEKKLDVRDSVPGYLTRIRRGKGELKRNRENAKSESSWREMRNGFEWIFFYLRD